uniref:Uncharacterized protein n=1 Tax=Cacopsylla melanoneura TaxID=428564 RepID=A0A8D8VEJ0_9HEMI
MKQYSLTEHGLNLLLFLFCCCNINRVPRNPTRILVVNDGDTPIIMSRDGDTRIGMSRDGDTRIIIVMMAILSSIIMTLCTRFGNIESFPRKEMIGMLGNDRNDWKL